jgi:hypothetical protein
LFDFFLKRKRARKGKKRNNKDKSHRYASQGLRPLEKYGFTTERSRDHYDSKYNAPKCLQAPKRGSSTNIPDPGDYISARIYIHG